MQEKTKVVIVGNIAFDVNTFPDRDNGKDKVVINNGGAGYYALMLVQELFQLMTTDSQIE